MLSQHGTMRGTSRGVHAGGPPGHTGTPLGHACWASFSCNSVLRLMRLSGSKHKYNQQVLHSSITSGRSYSKSSVTPTVQVTSTPLSGAGSKLSGSVSWIWRDSPTFMPIIFCPTPAIMQSSHEVWDNLPAPHAVVDGNRIRSRDVCLRSQAQRHGAMLML